MPEAYSANGGNSTGLAKERSWAREQGGRKIAVEQKVEENDGSERKKTKGMRSPRLGSLYL
jgi:hypothetical protein